MSSFGSVWIIVAVFAWLYLPKCSSLSDCVITPMKKNLNDFPRSVYEVLNCSFHGLIVDIVNWTRNGQFIKRDINKSWSTTVLINTSRDQDIGEFKCKAKKGQDISLCEAIPSKPKLNRLEAVKIVDNGRSPIVLCEAIGGWPKPRLSWWRNGVKLHNKDDGYTYVFRPKGDNTLSMKIVSIGGPQHGTHTCRAQNFFGTSVQEITIMVKRNDMILKDYRDQFPSVAFEGKNTTLECICSINECKEYNANAYWKFNSHNVKQSARSLVSKKVLNNGHVNILISILNISKADEGQYVCGINTSQGFEEKPMTLRVLEKGSFPRVLATSVNVLAKLHFPATLSCKAIYPRILEKEDTYWKVNNSLISKHSEHYRLREDRPFFGPNRTEIQNFELKIVNVSWHDFGCYFCGVRFEGDEAEETKICLHLDSNKAGGTRGTPPEDGSKNNPLVAISSITAGGIIMGFVIAFVAYRLCRSKRNTGEPFFESKDNGRQFRYDVFVTFSSQDLNWVRKELIPLVEKHELNYCIHHRDFEIGKPVVDNMAESVYTSRKVLAVMSHNYLSSKFCRGELEMALYRSTEMGDSSVIVMRIDGVDRSKLPKALRNRTFLDYHDFSERKNWEERLIKHLKPPSIDKSTQKNSGKTYSKLKYVEA